MARKSKAQRLSEATTLIAEYRIADRDTAYFSWEINFLKDIQTKLQRNKVLTPRQRAAVDRMISEGPRELPVLPPTEQAQFNLVQKNLKGEYEAEVAAEFHSKRLRGKELTEKQKAWFEKMVAQAQKIEDGTAWSPSSADLDRMDLILQCFKTYSSAHWGNCPKQRKAIEKISKYRAGTGNHLSYEQYESAQYAVRGTIKKIDNPKFLVGNPCWVREVNWNESKMNTENLFGVIVDGPFFSNTTRAVLYSVLVDGKLIDYAEDRIYKRRG